jgi:uncharacterized protein YjiS (DUF1127 family)
MVHLILRNVFVSRLRNIRQSWIAHAQMRHLRDELERLQSLGDHLIRDIGLDPDHVRQWLREDLQEEHPMADPPIGEPAVTAFGAARHHPPDSRIEGESPWRCSDPDVA